MPAQDKTGPNGQGPMTGRRMGQCAENNQSGNTTLNGGFGRRSERGMGRRYGCGNGFGFGMRYSSNIEPQNSRISNSGIQNQQALEEQVLNLQDRIALLEKKLNEKE